MRRRDPISTPARRRRIIADFSKVALRKLYIAACDNVRRFRCESAASLRLQSWWRACLARKQLQRLREKRQNRMALRIQCVARAFVALHRRRRLQRERDALLAERLARLVAHLWRARVARKAALMRAWVSRLKAAKRRHEAAVVIQRETRRHALRDLLSSLRHQRSLDALRRERAAVIAQALARGFFCRDRLRRREKRERAAGLVARVCVNWWRRTQTQRALWERERSIAAVKVQSYWRRCLAVRALRRRREKERVSAENALSHSLSVSLSPSPLPSARSHPVSSPHSDHKEHRAHRERVEIRVELRRRGFLSLLASPKEAIQWAVQSRLITLCHTHTHSRSHSAAGIRAGPAALQVLHYAEEMQRKRERHASVHREREPDHLSPSLGVSLAHCESLSQLLSSWDAASALSMDEHALTITREENERIEVCCEGERVSHRDTDEERQGERKEERQEQEEEEEENEDIVEYMFVIIPGKEGEEGEEDHQGAHDGVAFFRSAVVLLKREHSQSTNDMNMDTEIEGETEAEPIIAPEQEDSVYCIEFAQESESTSSEEDEEDDESLPSRAQTLPPIDEGSCAAKIQSAYRSRYRRRLDAVLTIQRFVRRIFHLVKWQKSVRDVLQIAHHSATKIQCLLRVAAAKQRLRKLREEYEEENSPFGHDFLASSERDNWAAFGLHFDDSFSAAARTGLVELDAYYCPPTETQDESDPPLELMEIVSLLGIPGRTSDCLALSASLRVKEKKPRSHKSPYDIDVGERSCDSAHMSVFRAQCAFTDRFRMGEDTIALPQISATVPQEREMYFMGHVDIEEEGES